MSYDLAVWHSNKILKPNEAKYIFLKLGQDEMAEVKPHLQITTFYNALVSKYPEISDENVDEAVWNNPIERSDSYIVMNLAYSRVNEVVPFVNRLAKQYGLLWVMSNIKV